MTTHRTSMPKSKVTCPHCDKTTDTGHLTEHIQSCLKKKVVCKLCGKVVARIRSHQCPPPKHPPHPQLSAYLDIEKHDWASKCPLEFENGIKHLSSLDEHTISLWNGQPPTLYTCKTQLSEETIYTLVLSAIRKSTDYQVFRDEEVPPELGSNDQSIQRKRSAKSDLEDKKFRMAAAALYQATTTAPRQLTYSLLNVWAPDTSEILMQPPLQFQSTHHVCTERFKVGINVTPKGSFVDLHHDILQRGLARTIGRCKKVWLLFPGTPKNLEIYVSSTGFRNRLARIGSKLEGGIIVETDSSHEIEFPAHTLHAVFTTVGGFLTGINYSTVECLTAMSQVLKAHLPIFHISPIAISEDVQSYIDALSSTLQMDLPAVLFVALQSWIELRPVIEETLDSGKTTARFQRQVQEVDDCLHHFGENVQMALQCGCGQFVDNIGNHVIESHRLLQLQ
ncbi:hypothetical protein ONS95_011579 [Cadophora gregata]|uniref:uncharacterized protein n=1 Tax=Cadophora gregata TaxID=51156 RepID=UPI0026DCCDFD|nr:uncharacterized protein ONS95_011579 [Cadophora gregata]KAK0120173.1 hypothetical protein ONS95_011579 [Cadophora gregata]KAK0121201.1 hypothetical protein ONS96_011380 [Cadophora gregata f. sp. sojae]